MEYSDVERMLATGTIHTDPAILVGMLITSDGVNSPAVVAYNAEDATDATLKVTPPVVVDPTITEFVGLFPNIPIRCRNGLHITIANLGSGEVMVYWRPM
jgi:hypothetical protein